MFITSFHLRTYSITSHNNNSIAYHVKLRKITSQSSQTITAFMQCTLALCVMSSFQLTHQHVVKQISASKNSGDYCLQALRICILFILHVWSVREECLRIVYVWERRELLLMEKSEENRCLSVTFVVLEYKSLVMV